MSKFVPRMSQEPKPAQKALPKAEDFVSLSTTEPQPGVGRLYVGEDHRLYRWAKGLLKLICPAEPAEKTEPELYFGGVDWDGYPPMEVLAYLYDTFLSKYDREVMFVVGKKYKTFQNESPWFFMVPNQKGTVGSIEWHDPEGMSWFAEWARWLGTVHIHPGSSADPSGTDLTHWKDKKASGLHVIFGREGEYTIHGSIAGHVVSLKKGNIKDTPRQEATLQTSFNKPLRSLLRTPPSLPRVTHYGRGQQSRGVWAWDSRLGRFVKDSLQERRGDFFPFDREDEITEEDWQDGTWVDKLTGHTTGKEREISSMLYALSAANGVSTTAHFGKHIWLVVYDSILHVLTDSQYSQYLYMAQTEWGSDVPTGTLYRIGNP